LTDLLLVVDAGVPGIGLHLLDREIANGQKGSISGTLCRPGDRFLHVSGSRAPATLGN
jgi:hypothetical protein